MQYILIDRERVKDRAFHETMPDGRVILPFSEVKMSGVLENVTIVPSAIALKAMIQEQKDNGVHPPLELPGTVESGDGETAGDGETESGDYEDYEEVEDAPETGGETGNEADAEDGTDAGEGLEGGLPEEGETVQGETEETAGEGVTDENTDIEEEEVEL